MWSRVQEAQLEHQQFCYARATHQQPRQRQQPWPTVGCRGWRLRRRFIRRMILPYSRTVGHRDGAQPAAVFGFERERGNIALDVRRRNLFELTELNFQDRMTGTQMALSGVFEWQ